MDLKEYKALTTLCKEYRQAGHKIDDHWFRERAKSGEMPSIPISDRTMVHPQDFEKAFARYNEGRIKNVIKSCRPTGDLFSLETSSNGSIDAIRELAQSMASSMQRIEAMIASMHDSLGCCSRKNS